MSSRGTEGTHPYGAGAWYYAEYRWAISDRLARELAARLGWSRAHRLLDLGAGTGKLALQLAPHLGEVVALEPDPEMLAEGVRRAARAGAARVRFLPAPVEDLPALAPSLGGFRAATMGFSFHWFPDRAAVLRALDGLVEPGGAVVIVTDAPVPCSPSPVLGEAAAAVDEILARHLAGVPERPVPGPRAREAVDGLLASSAFSQVERAEDVYQVEDTFRADLVIGLRYTFPHVLSRLGERRAAFEAEARAAVAGLEGRPMCVQRHDFAWIARRPGEAG